VLGESIPAGSMLAKALEESIEGALVRVGREIVTQSRNPIEAFEGLIDLYERQPRLGVRTSTSLRQQAYSTPLPIAYLASNLAGIDRTKTIYEPTAGHGVLVLGSDPSRAYANELNPDRAADLQRQGFITSTVDATVHQPPEQVDVVIANPPFGKVNGQSWQVRGGPATRAYRSTQLDHAIAFQSLSALKDEGRAVLILAAPMASKVGDLEKASNAYNGKQMGPFYKSLYDNYRVTEHITVGGELYGRQGTTFPVDVVVIEGRGKSSRRLPAVDLPKVYTSFESLKELLNHERTNQQIQPGDDPSRTGDQDQKAGGGDESRRDDAERGNRIRTGGVRPEGISGTGLPVEAAGGIPDFRSDGDPVSEQREDPQAGFIRRQQRSEDGLSGLSGSESGMDDASGSFIPDGPSDHYPLPGSGGMVPDRASVEEERDGTGMGTGDNGLQLRVPRMADGGVHGEPGGSELSDGTRASHGGGQGSDRFPDAGGMDDFSRNDLQGVRLMSDEPSILADENLDGESIRQVPYRAKSKAPNVETLVPANMRSSIGNALD
ncbi:MAG: hypothetical protein WCD18_03455, partial [Thermosynechococcaceae cyanobacterium]